MEIIEIMKEAIKKGASDIFIIAGLPITFKIGGVIQKLSEEIIKPKDAYGLISEIYVQADNRDLKHAELVGDDDFSFAIKEVSRFRVNTYKQRGTLAAVVRIITFHLPDPKALGIPDHVFTLAEYNKGLVLVTGSAGSGKSTTLTCMIDYINHNKSKHIITLEDPLEFLHSHNKSIVSQREIGTDTQSFILALRSALRQSPDVILIGELRDHETIEVAMTAAETGHLILSSLHTVGAANTIDRIIDAFPPNQQPQIILQLAMILQAIVSQQLVPAKNGGVVSVFEIMTVTPAIRNMIREGKVHQIDNILSSSGIDSGMVSMDKSLIDLYQNGIIEKETAIGFASNPEVMKRKIG